MLKKTIFILSGIVIILSVVIVVVYKNNTYSNEEVVDIFKNEDKEDKEEKEEVNDNKKVIVDIKGSIVNPGVYEVDRTSRVMDVISLAGGLLEDADTSLINLAKVVSDEMTIIIYSKEEVSSDKDKDKDECLCDCPLINNDACIEEEDTKGEEDNYVNINTCSKEELMTINGIGEAKAKAIIDYREKNGNFNTIEDIRNVSGIGDSLFEKIKAYITV